MPEVISDIVVTSARLWRSPTGTALPLDTVDVDAAWPMGWVDVGYTLEPVKAQYTFDVLDVMVQQEMGAVKRIRIKEALKLSTVLAELTAANLSMAFAGEVTSAAATSTLAGYEEFSIGGKYELPESQWGIEGSFVDEDEVLRPIRVFVWRATAAAGGELAFNREAVAGVPLEVSALHDLTKAKGRRLLAARRVLEDPTA
ncbi:hypothetical protein SE17_19935 [Kouleothrix aurantiaca]|uniref:Uncharacterized protein n=1 Tax=Kouleothrix aurantiaca TaxID=186479 RepID=A0A0P9DF04_9CHLR|nr:hypothetical protein SE17_19935 [Kouleothrix aurantiaca]